MKRIVYFISIIAMMASCTNIPTKPTATGAANEVLVVIDKDIENSAVGDSIFKILNMDLPCMPQYEPWFNISKTNHNGFTNLLKPTRNVIMVNVGPKYSSVKLKTEEEKWANYQSVMYINGDSIHKVAEAIGKYKYDILNHFVKAERKRAISYQTRYQEAETMKKIKEKFGFSMIIPKGLNRIKEDENFMWITNKNLDTQQSIVIYSYPYTEKDAFKLESILYKRDSVMMLNIPGPSEDSYMATEYKFAYPIFKETALQSGQYASEVRGLWTVKGDFMGGPFTSITCLDKENQRVITAEAFIYAPNKYKRNILRQLEANLYTIKFDNNGKD